MILSDFIQRLEDFPNPQSEVRVRDRMGDFAEAEDIGYDPLADVIYVHAERLNKNEKEHDED